MGIRIVFELLEAAGDDRYRAARRVLEEAGAQNVSPAGDGGRLVTAVLPDDADVDAVLDRLRRLEGVGRAEADSLRETFGPM